MTKFLQMSFRNIVVVGGCLLFTKLNGLNSVNSIHYPKSNNSLKMMNQKIDSSMCFFRFGGKMNLLSHIGAGIEFPTSKRTSLEFYIRSYSFDWPLGTNYSGANIRINMKYHIPIWNGLYPVESMFFVLGFNEKAKSVEGWKEQNLYIIDSYMADMAVFGFGGRSKKFEYWIAGERALKIYYNSHSKSYDRQSYYTLDRDNTPLLYSVSAGVAFYLFQSISFANLKHINKH